jgi:hypothetical protein
VRSFALESNFDFIQVVPSSTANPPDCGGGVANCFSGTSGSAALEGTLLAPGDRLRFSSDGSVTNTGFVICGIEPPSPPFPAVPPFAPQPANFISRRVPLVEAQFDVTPVNTSVTAAVVSIVSALRTLHNCDATRCEINLIPTEGALNQGCRCRPLTGFRVETSFLALNVTTDAYFVSGLPEVANSNDNNAQAALAQYTSNTFPALLVAQGLPPEIAPTGPATTAHVRMIDTPILQPPSPPPSPLPPPLSPPPPEPPAPPPGICFNTCNGGPDGICQDGTPSDTRPRLGGMLLPGEIACPPGTDCQDCGDVVKFCVNCPDECKRNNEALPLARQVQDACLDIQYQDGLCTPNCNNRACAYDGYDFTTGVMGDCTMLQIQTACTGPAERLPIDMTAPPVTTANRLRWLGFVNETVCDATGYSNCRLLPDGAAGETLVPVSLQMNLDPARMYIHEDYNELISMWTVRYTLQWEDERIFNHPCPCSADRILAQPRAVPPKSALPRSWTVVCVDGVGSSSLQALARSLACCISPPRPAAPTRCPLPPLAPCHRRRPSRRCPSPLLTGHHCCPSIVAPAPPRCCPPNRCCAAATARVHRRTIRRCKSTSATSR